MGKRREDQDLLCTYDILFISVKVGALDSSNVIAHLSPDCPHPGLARQACPFYSATVGYPKQLSASDVGFFASHRIFRLSSGISQWQLQVEVSQSFCFGQSSRGGRRSISAVMSN